MLFVTLSQLTRTIKLTLIAAAAFVAACTTTQVDSYERVPGAQVDAAYIKPGTDFSRYRRLYPMPLEIYYQEGLGAPTEADLERMRSIFRDAFLDEIDGDYAIVDTPASDALGVRASLVDLRNAPPNAELPVTGRLRSLVANGQLTFLMELSDSSSKVVLAHAADTDNAVSNIPAEEFSSDWQQAELAAQRWAAIFRRFLDENLGR